jgi:hypothetical protein
MPFDYDFTEVFLTAISELPAERSVALRFSRMGNDQVQLVAKGVERLRVNEFLEQNIVDELIIYGKESDVATTRNCLSELLFRIADAETIDNPAQIEKLEEMVNAVRSGSRQLLEIVPVYGASLVLLAESVSRV